MTIELNEFEAKILKQVAAISAELIEEHATEELRAVDCSGFIRIQILNKVVAQIRENEDNQDKAVIEQQKKQYEEMYQINCERVKKGN